MSGTISFCTALLPSLASPDITHSCARISLCFLTLCTCSPDRVYFYIDMRVNLFVLFAYMSDIYVRVRYVRIYRKTSNTTPSSINASL